MNKILRDLLAVLLVKSFSICHKGIYSKMRGIQMKSCMFSTCGEMLLTMFCTGVQTDMGILDCGVEKSQVF